MARSEDTHKKLGFFLKRIYSSKVALESEHSAKRKLLEFFMEKFITYCCSTNEIFRRLFQYPYYTGSYFEDLRVSEATEFDVDVVFSFPNLKYKITELDTPLSFATLQFIDPENIFSRGSDITEFFDSEKFLSAKCVLKWFQSLMDSFISHIPISYPGLTEIKTTHSGPARTVKLFFQSIWISVDLVPVIAFDQTLLQKFTDRHIAHLSEESLSYCFLVPKPLKSDLFSNVPAKFIDRIWRVHLPEAEKNIIIKNDTVKKLIKLVKYLRDQKNWPICSYFIKVMAFWLVKKYSHPKNWKDSNLGYLFLLFLEAMKQHFKVKKLSHISYPNFNLFHALSPRTMHDMKKCLHNIITKLKENPKEILQIYKICTSMSMEL